MPSNAPAEPSRARSLRAKVPNGGNGHGPDLERDRLASLEALVEAQQQALEEHRRTLDVQFKRMAAMQAELDHLTARKT